MKIGDFLSEKAITADLKATNKDSAIREMTDLLAKAEGFRNKDEVVKTLLSREALGSTGIGLGIGIPHGKSNAVKNLVAAFGISKKGINFDALDGEPVHIVFLLVAPMDAAGNHLKALAKISRLLKDKFFRQALRETKSSRDALKLIKDENEY